MNKIIYFVIPVFLFVVSFLLPGYFSSADILNNIPSFSEGNFITPKNSLLADPVVQFQPWRDFSKERIMKGELPMWIGHNSFGSPFFANPQTSVFFPTNLIYYFLPQRESLYLMHFLKIYLVFLFTYLYICAVIKRKKPAFLGGLLVSTSAFFLMWLQWPKTNVFLVLPLILYITEKIDNSKNVSRGWMIALSFAYFFAILGGHPETLFHISIVHLFYLIFKFFRRKNILFSSLVSILMGYLLGSIMLFPFIEYLFNSYALFSRADNPLSIFLPLKSLVFYIFPFVLGSPSIGIYRPITDQTNFQEVSGGFVGITTLLFVFFQFFKKNNKISLFWYGVIAVVFLFVYKIWPFFYIQYLPILNLSNNVRLIGFIAFGAIIIFSLSYENILRDNFINKYIPIKIVSFLTILSVLFLYMSEKVFTNEKIIFLISEIKYQALFYILNNFILLFLIKKGFFKSVDKSTFRFSVFTILIISQTMIFFWNYNPVIDQKKFYPKTSLIDEIKKYPRGEILEIGNMNLPENVNVFYGINNIFNYDALEIRRVRKSLDKSLGERNRWGRVENVDIDLFRKLGINYIVSDYDIRFGKENYIRTEERLYPVEKDGLNLVISSYKKIRGLRFMTATYNRQNSCTLIIKVQDQDESDVFSERISCSKFNNFMYYSIYFKNLDLSERIYNLKINTYDSSGTNKIAIVGSDNPVLEVLYENANIDRNLKLLWNRDNLFFWEISKVNDLYLKGDYKKLYESPENKFYLVDSLGKQVIKTKIPNFPGWRVYENGARLKIDDHSDFLNFEVGKGKKYIEISYQPASFIFGVIVSAVSFLLLIIISLRKIKDDIRFKNYISSIRSSCINNIFNGNPLRTFLYIAAANIFSVFLFVLVLQNTLSKWPLPYFTVNNWFKINNYSIYQDYFKFLLLIGMQIFVLIITIIFLCRKKK